MSIKSKLIIPLGLASLLAAGCAANTVSYNNSQTGNSGAPPSTASSGVPSIKFADQSYYKNAYLISGPSLSGEAKTALAGFKMAAQTMPDKTVQITLTALKAGYHDQQFTLKPGDQLYFIEKFPGDDSADTDTENNTIDDSAVVVDSQGNVVSQPTAWSPN